MRSTLHNPRVKGRYALQRVTEETCSYRIPRTSTSSYRSRHPPPTRWLSRSKQGASTARRTPHRASIRTLRTLSTNTRKQRARNRSYSSTKTSFLTLCLVLSALSTQRVPTSNPRSGVRTMKPPRTLLKSKDPHKTRQFRWRRATTRPL